MDINLASLAVSEDVHPQLVRDPRLVNAPQKMVLSGLPCSSAFLALGSNLLSLHLDNTRLQDPSIPPCWAALLRIESISCGGWVIASCTPQIPIGHVGGAFAVVPAQGACSKISRRLSNQECLHDVVRAHASPLPIT